MDHLDRTDQGRQPHFITIGSPTDADVAAVCSGRAEDVIQKSSQ
jgi:hypothetical protein